MLNAQLYVISDTNFMGDMGIGSLYDDGARKDLLIADGHRQLCAISFGPSEMRSQC